MTQRQPHALQANTQLHLSALRLTFTSPQLLSRSQRLRSLISVLPLLMPEHRPAFPQLLSSVLYSRARHLIHHGVRRWIASFICACGMVIETSFWRLWTKVLLVISELATQPSGKRGFMKTEPGQNQDSIREATRDRRRKDHK